jgi:aspartate kinase
MSTVVHKYGGTSLDGPDRIRRAARRVVEAHRAGHDVIAVVSAMGRTTDAMLAMAHEVSPSPPRRELDMLATAGERIAMALFAMAVGALGADAISFTGSQSGIITTDDHGNARIKEVRPVRIREELARGRIVIVAGYQGVSEAKEITTLGRGGTDLTAVALAAAFDAVACELYKDVEGVHTGDPRVCPDARCLVSIPARAMEALSRAGAQVLYEEAVRYAIEKGVEPVVRGTFHPGAGTRVVLEDPDPGRLYGVALDADPETAQVSVVGGESALDALALDLPPGVGVPERSGPLTLRWPRVATAQAGDLARRLHARLPG